MTKYFDKLIKNKLYIVCYLSHENMKKKCHFGKCGFLLKFIKIINKNIFHYLMSKNSKKIFI